jgi:hypothetical protein
MVNWEKIVGIFKEKLIFKKIYFTGYTDFFEEKRLKNLKRAWTNSLQNHIRMVEVPNVETV